jgi:hypothetical protein
MPDGADCPDGRAYNRRVEFTVTNYPTGRLVVKKPDVPDEFKVK